MGGYYGQQGMYGGLLAPPPEEEDPYVDPAVHGDPMMRAYDMAPASDPVYTEYEPAPVQHGYSSPEAAQDYAPTGAPLYHSPPYEPYGIDDYRYGGQRDAQAKTNAGAMGVPSREIDRMTPPWGNAPITPPPDPVVLRRSPGPTLGDAPARASDDRFRYRSDQMSGRPPESGLIEFNDDPGQFTGDFFTQVADWTPFILNPEQGLRDMLEVHRTNLRRTDPTVYTPEEQAKIRAAETSPYVPDPLRSANFMLRHAIWFPRKEDKMPDPGEPGAPPPGTKESYLQQQQDYYNMLAMEMPEWAREPAVNMANTIRDAEINPWAGPYWLYGHPRPGGAGHSPIMDEATRNLAAGEAATDPDMIGLYGGQSRPAPRHRYREE